jgi:hypothetical protein
VVRTLGLFISALLDGFGTNSFLGAMAAHLLECGWVGKVAICTVPTESKGPNHTVYVCCAQLPKECCAYASRTSFEKIWGPSSVLDKWLSGRLSASALQAEPMHACQTKSNLLQKQ